MPRIVCISDTHNFHRLLRIPDGDILIHSGDATLNGTEEEFADFADWFAEQPHPYKIFVAGNHDLLFEQKPETARLLLNNEICYLEDYATVIEGFKVYGSPWQPRFYDWAFNLERGQEMAEKWSLIPSDVDILITHGPPNGFLDAIARPDGLENAGCEELRAKLNILLKGSLRLHIFGHIHEGYGVEKTDKAVFINASICNAEYNPCNTPIVVEL